MSLDDKLRGLYDGHPDHMEEWLTDIKQAFADEGFISVYQGRVDKPTMTGQEWYDRFEKELKQSGFSWDIQNGNQAEAIFDVNEAAKKASGLQ